MKRTISLIVSLIMCFGLSGCGNGQKPEIRVRTGSKSTSAAESTATTTVFEPDKEVIEKGEKQNNKIVVHMGDDTSSENDTSSSSKPSADSSSNSENSSKSSSSSESSSSKSDLEKEKEQLERERLELEREKLEREKRELEEQKSQENNNGNGGGQQEQPPAYTDPEPDPVYTEQPHYETQPPVQTNPEPVQTDPPQTYIHTMALVQFQITLNRGEGAQINTAYEPSNATVSLDWQSNRTDRVTVDGNGYVTAVGTGSAIITATDSYTGLSGSCMVTVN